MLRSAIAIISGPLVYGAICVPTTWLVVHAFPTRFDDQWITNDSAVLMLLVSLTILFAGASGYVAAWIAQSHILKHTIVLCVLQLGIGIAVQSASWDNLPMWYHLSFFMLLVLGIGSGAWLRSLKGSQPHGISVTA